MLRRVTLLAALSLSLLSIAAPAGAHVEIVPAEAVAGSSTTLRFNVAFEGAATTGLEVQLPEGASVVEVPEKDGWTSSVDEVANTVSWSGGSIADDVTFDAVIQLPPEPGEVLFPSIQLTTEGEVAWISEAEGEGHDEGNPSPRLLLVADPNGTTTTTADSTTTTTETTTTTTLDLADDETDDDDSSAVPWIIAAVVVAAGGGAVWWFARRRSHSSD